MKPLSGLSQKQIKIRFMFYGESFWQIGDGTQNDAKFVKGINYKIFI